MIEQFRDKNRIIFVTAAFRSKFLRNPNHTELSKWVENYKRDSNPRNLFTELAAAARAASSHYNIIGARAMYFQALLSREINSITGRGH